MQITYNRWQEAQEFEVYDWANQPNIVELEWEEASIKYKSIFKQISRQLQLNSKSKILDVGCSLTCISRLIKVGKHYGIDPLADKLDIQNKVKNVIIKSALGESIPYKDNYFDLIICRNVIDHTYSPKKVLQEMKRVIKPNGHLIIAVYTYNPFISLIKNIGEYIKIFRNIGHPHTYTTMSIKKFVSIYFTIINYYLIHQGNHPNDFGKINEKKNRLPIIQNLILIISRLLNYSYFVKEDCFLTKPNK